MSKLKALIIVVLVLALGTAVLYFVAGGKSPSGNPVSDYLPFGKAPDNSTNNNPQGSSSNNFGSTTSEGSGETTGSTFGNQPNQTSFFKISDAPVAGYVVLNFNGTPWVRYVDRATGHVSDVNLTTLERVKIYNTTNPKVYEAIFKTDGSGYISRQLVDGSDTILNFSSSLIPPKPNSTSTDGLYSAQTSALPTNLGEIAVLPNNSLLYSLADTGDLISNAFAGSKPKLILSSGFGEWSLAPLGTTSALLSTKPTALALGYAYSLNLSNGNLTKLLSPLTALSVIPNPDGKRLLYSYVDGGGSHVLTAKNLTSGTSLDISPVTLAEKCVWSKKVSAWILCGVPMGGVGDSAPDNWYLGINHYSDKIWRFNMDTDTAEVLADPSKDFGVNIDVINPELSPNEDYLILQNKNDYSLWVLKI